MESRFVHLKGGHYEIGLQHGKQLRNVITDRVIPFVENDFRELRMASDRYEDVIPDYEELLREHFPKILEETRGISDGAGISYSRALLVLLFWEIKGTTAHYFPECSSFVAAGAATSNGFPIASQNTDWPRNMREREVDYTFRMKPKNAYDFIGRGLAGNLGRPSVIGFNEKGLGFVGSGIRQLKEAGFGFPPLIATRLGIETCGTVDEFLDFVKSISEWSHAGENVDVVDARGNMARISFSTKRIMILEGKNHFIASTNHYHNEEMRRYGPLSREVYPSSWARYDRLVSLLYENYGLIDMNTATKIMSDHEFGNVPPEGANSICRHGQNVQTMTNILFTPTTRDYWISHGNPCRSEYTHYRL